jgi:hypothetical protein
MKLSSSLPPASPQQGDPSNIHSSESRSRRMDDEVSIKASLLVCGGKGCY